MSQAITQKHGCGCSVACAAYILNVSYDTALKLFSYPQKAIDRGFLCGEITRALKKDGLNYSYEKVTSFNKHQNIQLVTSLFKKKIRLG